MYGTFNYNSPSTISVLGWDVDYKNNLRGDLKSVFTLTCTHPQDQPKTYRTIHNTAKSLEGFLLGRLIPTAVDEFIVEVDIMHENFDAYIRDAVMEQNVWTKEWLNMNLMNRIVDWMKNVVPTYRDCFLTDEKMGSLEVFNTNTVEMENIYKILSEKNTNGLMIVQSRNNETTAIDTRRLDAITESDSIRYPCIVPNSMDAANILVSEKLVDLQKLGIPYNTLVRFNLLGVVLRRRMMLGKRIFTFSPVLTGSLV